MSGGRGAWNLSPGVRNRLHVGGISSRPGGGGREYAARPDINPKPTIPRMTSFGDILLRPIVSGFRLVRFVWSIARPSRHPRRQPASHS
jgi:hypothetical protein